MKKWSAVAFLLTAMAILGFGQQMKSLEFRDQEIRDLLFALAKLNNVSIIPDETVQGRASFYFAEMDFEKALTLFLGSYQLNFYKKNDIYYVSKIFIADGSAPGTWIVKGTDVPIRSLLNVLSTRIGKTILFDPLPGDAVNINADSLPLDGVLAIIAARLPDFVLEKQEGYFYLRKKEAAAATGRGPSGSQIKLDNGRFTIQTERIRFRDFLNELFIKNKQEFVLLLERDGFLDNFYFKDKTFEELLRLALLQIGGDFTVQNGIYYIFEIQKRELLKKFYTTMIVPLKFLSTQDFFKLLPPTISGGTQIKMDDKGNKIILSGSVEEIAPIASFIGLIDNPNDNTKSVRIDLSYVKADDVLPLLPNDFAGFTPVVLPGRTSFLISLPEKKVPLLKDLIQIVDRQEAGFPIRLNYIKTDELLANLPPSAGDQSVKKTSDPTLFFYKGSEGQRKNFLKDLAEIDKPRPQIKYQILVLQIEEKDSFGWTPSLIQTPTASSASGNFSEIIKLDFDVISSFGYNFALNLNWSLKNNKGNVIADTSISALSGEKVTFHNTNTQRYKDTEVLNPSTPTATPTPVIRELSSGLILSLEGWVSGNGMISVKIDASLSKKGNSGSDASDLSTTEKKISTQVRTFSGKPLIIGGLKQQEIDEAVSKVPFLGDIPLLGWLFQSKSFSTTNSQFVINVIPYLEPLESARATTEAERIEKLYQFLVEP